MTPDLSPEPPARGPLSYPWFRAIWVASLASNLGTWMQSVGAAWLMTSLTSSPELVALLQSAASVPVLLLGLPAGALADIVDRRRLLLVAQLWMLLVAAALGGLTITGLMSPWGLLLLTFLLGLGAALTGPAWQATVPDLVDAPQVPAAIALNSAGFNLARAVGPALGGLIVAAAGPGPVFLVNAVSFLAVLLVIARWRTPARPPIAAPESVTGAIQAGVRYARHAPELRAVLARTALFILPASALWALLPVVARQDLGLDAGGYGVLFGCLGVGAVLGAVSLTRLRRAAAPDALVVAASLLFAAATFALAFVRNQWLLGAALLAGGVAWTTCMASLNVTIQTAAPAWVRARALAVYLLVFQGGLAFGSPIWGVAAGIAGNPGALAAAALLLAAGTAGALRWRLPSGPAPDLRPALHWPEPALAMRPPLDDGPVLVRVAYTVDDANAAAFIAAMAEVRRLRRRDGATSWGLFQDLADGSRFVETFLVPSWAEHLRQHERVTVADQAVEARALALQRPGTIPDVVHAIAARSRPSNDAPQSAAPTPHAPRPSRSQGT